MRRIRMATGGALVALCTLLILLTISNIRWTFDWSMGYTWSGASASGMCCWSYRPGIPIDRPARLSAGLREIPFIWWPRWMSIPRWGEKPPGLMVWVPNWLLVLPAATLAGAVLWPDIRRLRRRAPWACPSCGYDRRGLTPAAPCPECGKPIAPQSLTR